MEYVIETYKCRMQISENPAPTVRDQDTAVRVARSIFADLDEDQEHMTIIALDGKNHVIGFKTLFTGTISQCTIGSREVYRAALILGASSIIWFHNHPTGVPEPSLEDKNLHNILKSLGEALNVRVLDGIILGHGKYYSMTSQMQLDG